MRRDKRGMRPSQPRTQAPVPTPAEEPAAPEEPTVAAQDPQEDEPWINPLVAAAQRGEQVEFGGTIVDVTATDDTQE